MGSRIIISSSISCSRNIISSSSGSGCSGDGGLVVVLVRGIVGIAVVVFGLVGCW